MVPHTYPTIEGRLVLGVITDITGLNEWQDYIPVVAQTNPVASSRNTFANDGYMGVNVLSSLTGLNAWIDYIPCYVVTGRSSPFSVSPDGYISVSAEVGTLGGASLADYIINSKTPDLVADFNGSLNTGTEFYDAGGTVDTFAELITHSRAGNATMTDGYGPELASNVVADWVPFGGGSAVQDGEWIVITGVTANSSGVNLPLATEVGKQYAWTMEIELLTATIFDTQLTKLVSSADAFSPSSFNYVTTNRTIIYQGIHTDTTAGSRLTAWPRGVGLTARIRNVSVREVPAIKWAPHNLLTYSEDFSNAAWSKQSSGTGSIPVVTPNQGAAPDGTLTADRIEFNQGTGTGNNVYSLVSQNPPLSNALRNVSLWMKSNTGSDQVILAYNAGNSVGDEFTVTSEWQLFTLDKNTSYSNSNFAAGDSSLVFGLRGGAGAQYFNGTNTPQSADILVWGAHLYRSDLGGMVDNPDRGDSYVPTTSSAVYLPRRDHHVYNGSAWVNEGVLHESEARTNLITYSDFDSLGWSQQAVTLTSNSSVSPDGTQSASLITELATNSYHRLSNINAISPANTISVYLKKHSRRYIGVRYQGTTYQNAEIDLDTQSFGYLGADIISTSVEDVGNDWNRYSITTGGTFGAVGFLTSDVAITSDTIPSFLGVIDQGVYLWGAQAEAGSTPSSYIPTNGSTVSRALETLTIPAANMPWPEPNYIGPELVVNGTFDSASDWVTSGNVAISSGVAVFGSGTTAVQGLVQNIGLVGGKVYQYSFDVSGVTGGEYLRVKFGEGGDSFIVAIAGTKTGIIVSSGGTANIDFRPNTTLTTSNITLDNVSVREIDPLAVSIQMQGRVTYADTGGTDQFIQWGNISGEEIREYLVHGGSQVGTIQTIQRFGGVVDVVNILNVYQPGVLVPFNFASRHGSTFVNAAADGVSATVNTTPVGLPDVSATDFNLGYDYMGTISMLRVWADDLADVGIAEATEPSEVPSLQLTFDNSETSFTIQDWEQ